MKPFLKNKHFFIGVLFASATLGLTAFASTDLVSASDAQHFEQTYEDWAKSVLKNLDPKLDFTVLSRVEFSRNPEYIQDYEDMKAANHLPGLPDLTDPNYSNPLDSPLYALVAKKNFKVIFQNSLSSTEAELVREVLTAKLRLGSDDGLNFEYLNKVVASKTEVPKLNFSLSALFTLFSGIALVLGAFFSLRRKSTKFAEKFTTRSVKSVTTNASLSVDPLALTNKPARPVMTPPEAAAHSIQIAATQVLKKALLNEKAELIAKASLHASKNFSNRILGECEQDKFDLTVQWITAHHKEVTLQESNYARLLLSARIQQVQNERVLDSIEAFNKAREMKLKFKQSPPVVVVKIRSEVNEATL